MILEPDRLRSALGDLGEVVAAKPMAGGTSPVFRLDLAGGGHLVLKVYPVDQPSAAGREAFAAAQLAAHGLPVNRTLLIDASGETLPFPFAVTSHLPGVAAITLGGHPGIGGVYREMGALLRRLHAVRMPGYGFFDATGIVSPAATNAEFERRGIEVTFARFVEFGGDPVLARRLSAIVDACFDAVVPHSRGAVFAHNDLHPGNILVTEAGDGTLSLSGLIDFGSAFAGDAVSDLAKCMFCSEHDAPGCRGDILAGYGAIDHPDPEAALAAYTLLHRVTMWWWLRRTGAIPAADTPSGLIDALRATAGG